MSAGIQIQMAPDTGFSVKDLDTFLYALEHRFQSKEIMQKQEAAKYVGGISVRMLERLSSDDIVPSHFIPGTSIRIWLKSELVSVAKTWGSRRTKKAIKNHKVK